MVICDPILVVIIIILIHTVVCIVAPEILVSTVNTIIIDGDEAVFNCTVDGDPLPTISWYISGVDLSLSNMVPFDQEGRIDDDLSTTTILNTTTVMSTLTLNTSTPFLADDYVCVASNSLGNVNSTAIQPTLTVNGEFIANTTS